MSELVLIRGLPGSGKSTFARSEYSDYVLVEADAWFETTNGYKFDKFEVTNAHRWCQSQTECLLRQGKNVVVANTFVKRWEIAPYAAIAIRTKATLRVYTVKGKFENVHGVPDVIIEEMKLQWENLESGNIIEIVVE